MLENQSLSREKQGPDGREVADKSLLSTPNLPRVSIAHDFEMAELEIQNLGGMVNHLPKALAAARYPFGFAVFKSVKSARAIVVIYQGVVGCPSNTNYFELLASYAVKKYRLKPDQTMFMQADGAHLYQLKFGFNDFDLVELSATQDIRSLELVDNEGPITVEIVFDKPKWHDLEWLVKQYSSLLVMAKNVRNSLDNSLPKLQ
jgi:hypothetical protein